MDYKTILAMDPFSLIEWLHKEFDIINHFPLKIVTKEEMEMASELLLVLTSYNSYLLELVSYAKCSVRKAKRELSKTEYEDMVDKRDAIINMQEDIEQQYKAISRAVTVKIENTNAEFKLNPSRYSQNQGG